MVYKRKWAQRLVQWRHVAVECQSITDEGWNVHTILPTARVVARREGDKPIDDGAIIIAYIDEPDLSGGVPR